MLKFNRSITARGRRMAAAHWSLRRQAGDMTVEEQRSFAAWLAADQRHPALYHQAALLLRAVPATGRMLAAHGIARPHRSRTTLRTARIAVAGIGVAMLLTVAFLLGDGPIWLRADYLAASDEMPVIALADGSLVQLDASSAISVDFTDRRRRINLLRGEAFFSVTADATRPFVVVAGAGTTTALGTKFDVLLAADGRGATATAVEHGIAVTTEAAAAVIPDRQARFLSPGEQVTYTADGVVSAVRPVIAGDVAAWRRGRLIFENATLAEVVEQLQRHARTRIVIANAALAQRRISGNFDISDPLAAVDVLERTFKFDATHLGRMMIILHG